MFFYIIAFALIVFGCFNFTIAVLGLFPKFQCKTVGVLSKAKTYRGLNARRFIPLLTDYTYIYTVKGKEYKYSAANNRTKNHLLPRRVLVYVKWFPRRVYPDKFKGTNEWVFGSFYVIMGILLLLVIKSSP